MTTRMPAATIAFVMPSPMPLAPPVTNATFPSSCSMPVSCNERGAPAAGRASHLTASVASVEIARELHVPLAQRARLAFHGRLAERREVELVEVVLLVREVR